MGTAFLLARWGRHVNNQGSSSWDGKEQRNTGLYSICGHAGVQLGGF